MNAVIDSPVAAPTVVSAPYAIDVSKGACVGTVSSQWASRSDDQRFTNLYDLRARVDSYRTESRVVDVLPSEIVASASGGALTFDVAGTLVEPTHWAFDQIARVAGAPSYYLRTLPAEIAADAVNHGLRAAEAKAVSAYVRENGSTTIRGITSTRYGRIYDVDVVDAAIRVAGSGRGEARWKVPGCIDWSGEHGVVYNPNVEITKENTTLYASDRDVFLFLVDDRNPIEVGKLANGDPDLMFRGFYVWNSEVGSRTFGFASMYLRGVCQNRNLWGVEGFREMTFKHTTFAPSRFLAEAEPAILEFANGSTTRLVAGVQAAKAAIVARTDEERIDFLDRYGFSAKQARTISETSIVEEGRPPESVWDFAQGITAVARSSAFQDARIKLESIAGRMLDKVAVPA